jgi:hypothetical protein
MTEKYVLTSEKFDGELILEFDLNGILKNFVNDATLTDKQLDYFRKNFPITKEIVLEIIKAAESKTLKAVHYPCEITFEDFWDLYDYKAISNKAESRKRFEKLTKAERVMLMEDIPKYNNRLKLQNGIAKKHAETYIHKREWDKK